MESEEQKPKDINERNEREIKQETDDFVNNVKEDSIEEEEHSEPVIPNQKTRELLENFKEEPIDEEYVEQIIPKLEEVIEPSASYMTNNPVQKSCIQTQNDAPKLYAELPRKPIKRYRCPACLQMHATSSMKYVTMKEDTLIIMIACVLRGDYSLEKAQSYMSAGRKVYICYVHFPEALNEIYKFLRIKNNVEITSCSSELINNLMVTVNTIYPKIETAQFCDILHNVVRRNILQNRRCSTNGEQSKMQQNLRCSMCTKNGSCKNMKYVTMEADKLVIMVGCVLRGEYTFEQAHSFIYQKKNYVPICHIHFSGALNEIYKAVNIKHPDEVSSCSVELMRNLMITVNKLCPRFEHWQFRRSLNNFFTRNKRFIQMQSDFKL